MLARRLRITAVAAALATGLVACWPAVSPKSCPWQASARSGLTLDGDERAALATKGFVISDRKRFPGFAEGWLAIYKADLPLYVSADALLHVVHRSYDAILEDLELVVLVPRLKTLLEAMRARLEASEGRALPAQARVDADLFTGVALRLLEGSMTRNAAGADAREIDQWVSKVKAATGVEDVSLFGSQRTVDFSQFKPRGHYADDEEVRTIAPDSPSGRVTLAPYFRTVMWLGRTDLWLAVPTASASLALRRRELELACALRALMGPAEMSAWAQLETTMNTFVGARDAMGPRDIDRLYEDLGVAGLTQLAGVSDEKVLSALTRGHYGDQRIATQIVPGSDRDPVPLPAAFSFTGQRYIVDSHIFSEVVYDRVPTSRLMPDPLDVAYAVFDSDPARKLLAPELARYGYGPKLQALHAAVQSNGEAFWQTSLYSLWLGAIRALSSPASPTLALKGTSPAPPGPGQPLGPTSDAWQRRILSTQLASWAELRHDTIVYAKQSYTASMIICSFPDVYVDPYPAFYQRLASFADKGRNLARALDFGDSAALRDRIDTFFRRLADAARRLGLIAQEQQRGERPSDADLDFINHAVDEEPPRKSFGCGGGSPRVVRGWYIDLFFDGSALDSKPTIADVHTQPTDADGNRVGRILHVATGQPRLMVVQVDAGGRAREFTGVVSSYYEVVTKDFERLTDQAWRGRLPFGPSASRPEDVAWMRDFVVR
jgi:hypothetical protein